MSSLDPWLSDDELHTNRSRIKGLTGSTSCLETSTPRVTRVSMWHVGWLSALAIAAAGCERAVPAHVEEVHDWLDQIHCRLQDGVVECKGLNTKGIVRPPAAEVVVDAWHRIPVDERVVRLDLSVTGSVACVATAPGHVYCWGDAYDGALGNGELPPADYRKTVTARPVPQRVIGLNDVKDLGLGVRQVCALTRVGAVFCWGTGSYGALGNGNGNASSATPILVIADGATSISVSDFQTCARMSTGRVLCWGDHLPDGSGVLRPALRPTEVANVDDATGVTGDRVEMCVRRRGGKRQCWRTMPGPTK